MRAPEDAEPRPADKAEAEQPAKPDQGTRAEPDGKDRPKAPYEAVTAVREIAEQLAGLSRQIAGGINSTYLNTTIMTGSVNASNATFGTADGRPREETGPRARTGRLGDEEIAAAREHFAAPPKLGVAATALARDRIVVVTGPSGLGKRTAAIRLLLDVGATSLEVVSPTLTLEELSKHTLKAGHGYLVEDWQQGLRADGTGDYNWRVLRDHVTDAEGEDGEPAYLVITTTAAKASQCVTHLSWQAPTAAEVLAVYLASPDAGDLISQITAEIPDGYPGAFSVGSVAAIGRKLVKDACSPKSKQEILDALSSDPERHVREWLSADDRTDDDIQRVAVLCFAAARSERIYEVMLLRFEVTLRDLGLLDEPEAGEKTKDDDGAAQRGAPRVAGGLRGTRTRSRSSGIIEREAGQVRFQGKAERQQYLHHRHSVQELWRDYDIRFWLAVREWLAELVGDSDLHEIHVSVAVGLTMLAFVALDEVEKSYLHPWATGERAWAGQRTAVYVLWLMSRDDSLSPVALRIATDWANTGDPACQWTAAAALSGELGAAYPSEAAARLWHLVGQWSDVPTKAVMAMANLFATLTKEQDAKEAHQVLELLRDRLARASSPSPDEDKPGGATPLTPSSPLASWRENRKNKERAMLCIVELLEVRDPLAKQPSIASFLHDQPDHLDLVAELWAVVLRNRMYRKRALVALLEAVRGFEYVGYDDPEAAARSLGDALTAAMPHEREQHQLTADFTNIVARVTRPGRDTAPTVKALLNAFEHLIPERKPE
jgi:hypothetical protein